MKKLLFIALLFSATLFGQSPFVALVQNQQLDQALPESGIIGIDDETTLAFATGTADIRGQQFTADQDLYMTHVSIYHDGLTNSSSLTVAIYDDVNDSPNELIGYTYTAAQTKNGWNRFKLIKPTFVTTGQKFWLSWAGESINVKYDSDAGESRFRSNSNFSSYWYSTSEHLPWVVDISGIANFKYAIYAEYQVAEPVRSDTMTFVTRSRLSTWSPQTITKTGATLSWTATGYDGTDYGTQNVNDPTFDFSGNTAMDDIIIEVTSSDGWDGLTAIDTWVPNDLDGGGSWIYYVDLPLATNLYLYNTRYSRVMGVDLRGLTGITDLTTRGRQQYAYGIDLSETTGLQFWQSDGSWSGGFDRMILPSTAQLDDVRIYDIPDGNASTSFLDAIINLADVGGVSSGNIQFLPESPTPTLSADSYAAYNSLIGKSWTIDISSVGPEISGNVTFDDATNVSLGTGWTISNGTANYDGTGGTSAITITLTQVATVGQTLRISWDVIDTSGNTGTNPIDLSNSTNRAFDADFAIQSYSVDHTVVTNNVGTALIYGRAGETIVLDNFKVQIVN